MKKWHSQNVMPEKPTMEQRIAWHINHHKNCGCRDIPENIKLEIKNRKLAL